jgi:hypothetical protein
MDLACTALFPFAARDDNAEKASSSSEDDSSSGGSPPRRRIMAVSHQQIRQTATTLYGAFIELRASARSACAGVVWPCGKHDLVSSEHD